MRSYNQFCPAARALDVVGDRWTLLIVRELLLGPKRYTDLKQGLPGIGPTLLSDRLRSLEEMGILRRRRLAPPAASTIYELTELGLGLRPVLSELFRWGLRMLNAPGPDDAIRASWLIGAIEAAAQPEQLPRDVADAYEFRIGDEIVTVTAGPVGIEAQQGPAAAPTVVVETDPETFAALGMRAISPEEAVRAEKLVVEGDPDAAARCAKLFGVLEPEVEAAHA